MSRSKIYFLICIILLPIVAPNVLWQWQNYTFYRDFTASEQSSTVQLEVASLSDLHWVDGDEEVKVGDMIYDVVSIHKTGSRYQIALKSDSLETAALSIYTNNTTKHKSYKRAFCFVISILTDVSPHTFKAPLTQLSAWVPYEKFYSTHSLNTLSPPPNLFCC